MKLGILSDIHGNHYALREVLKSAQRQDVQQLLVLGDVVGYYYYPDEVLDLLSGWSYNLIQGNHEGLVGEVINKITVLETITARYGRGLEFAFKKLKPDVLNKLATLPHDQSIIFDSVRFNICHGSPWNRDEYVYPDAPPDIINRCSIPDTDFVLMGHTHRPCIFKDEKTFIANVGSVGQSRVSGGIANWAIINTLNKSYIPQATSYNKTKLIKAVLKIDPQLPYLAEVLMRD